MLPEGFEQRDVRVSANLRESSPEEAERHVAIPIEEALGTVAGIESLHSRCNRGEVSVRVELRQDANATEVEAEVRDRVRRVEPDLPDEVNRVRVRRRSANDRPVMFYACTAKLDCRCRTSSRTPSCRAWNRWMAWPAPAPGDC
jgi:HAE1 family hydrophobic/amphiphilic exporter-1